jgi:hypothetical protein
MSNKDDENINKIFNELMSSNNIEDELSPVIDFKSKIKDFIHIQESLMESLININSVIYYTVNDPEYKVDQELNELMNSLYKISEDFIGYIGEVSGTIEFVEDYDFNEEDGNDTGNGESQ